MSMQLAASAFAHEVRPSVANVKVGPETIEIQVIIAAEAFVAGINLDGLEDTNDAPESGIYDNLRSLPPAAMVERFRTAWPGISAGLTIESGGETVAPILADVVVRDDPNEDLPRDTLITVTGELPDGGAPVVFGWSAGYGPLVVRQIAGNDAYSGYLTGGALSEPMPRDGVAEQSVWQAFVNYVIIGFEHIVPKGLDHILFVLGLFFFSLKLRPLLYQVTAFTVAHTVTLALATLGLVSIPASVVEPLIALSIVYIAAVSYTHLRAHET